MADVAARSIRHPLTENTNRANAAGYGHGYDSHKPRSPYPASVNTTATRDEPATPASFSGLGNPASAHTSAPGSRVPSVLNPPSEADDNKRYSQASSTSSSSRYKSHIGPWQLGKTLGKGSSARVRLCRHTLTDQLAAVKIVNRRMAYLVQDSSLAALSKWDKGLPEQPNGEMRVPMAIEREVAILKLIEHPHIMKLYDIWENRSEIYLVLEYIDQGDLFTYINSHGRLAEDVALYFFRQMISAITYCHSFNICHRDLKPENILITADLQIKIADFGMAALHQTDTHQLATACGSPHYAAPELLKNKQYRGDRADIWSMGVILYAMLSATLPFDDPDLRVMMGKTKKGQYEMPHGLSLEAEDLIRRMLQTNPDRRITLKEIWRHPLVQKYSYLDNLSDNTSQLPDTRKGFQYTPVPRQSLDPQLIRQLRSMWHMFSEQDLALKLTCDEPNDQKAFYWLLFNYRNQQLEDFKPELAHSMSDYHHLKPGVWKKRVSTCEFATPRGNGHGRSVSRFTVISNATETDGGALHRCNTYRSSRALNASPSQGSQTRAGGYHEIQSPSNYASQAARMRSGSNARQKRINSIRGSMSGKPASFRGSMTSLQSSRQGTPQAHKPNLRHKRGVDFSHVRKRSGSINQAQKATNRMASITIVDVDDHAVRARRSASPDLPTLATGETHTKAITNPKAAAVVLDAASMLNDEIRQFSNTLARDLDEAFGSSLIDADSAGGSLTDSDGRIRESSPLSFTFDSATGLTTPASDYSVKPWDSRPLPPLPKERALSSHPVMANAVTYTKVGTETNAHRASSATLQPAQQDRRIVSAPVYPYGTSAKPTSLPSINENGSTTASAQDKARIVSAPPHTPTKRQPEQLRSVDHLSQIEPSIRVVHSPTAYSPVKVPAPLNVRKKSGVSDLHIEPRRPSSTHVEPDELSHETSSQASQDATKQKKKMSWFKRGSKAESENRQSSLSQQSPVSFDDASGPDHDQAQPGVKKKGFGFSFWKNGKDKEPRMSINEEPEPTRHSNATTATNATTKVLKKTPPTTWRESASSSGIRHIEVKQNWLTRLFKVKPATGHICMLMSRKRARQEVAILLREWRKYGIRDVTIDKQRNIVSARVAPKNYLNLKEVEFVAEIMAVIEHGKKQPLSIIRFTQERGAASSFHRVVETMKTVFENRNLAVTDKNRRKMMIKTLNSHE
ncbi:protein kinase domain-containing protein [Sarocladium implicatum]|nr:protein kinase domain-containing protein [Sarocladium implicatum]